MADHVGLEVGDPREPLVADRALELLYLVTIIMRIIILIILSVIIII